MNTETQSATTITAPYQQPPSSGWTMSVMSNTSTPTRPGPATATQPLKAVPSSAWMMSLMSGNLTTVTAPQPAAEATTPLHSPQSMETVTNTNTSSATATFYQQSPPSVGLPTSTIGETSAPSHKVTPPITAATVTTPTSTPKTAPSSGWMMAVMSGYASKKTVPPPVPTAAKPPIHHKNHHARPRGPLPPPPPPSSSSTHNKDISPSNTHANNTTSKIPEENSPGQHLIKSPPITPTSPTFKPQQQQLQPDRSFNISQSQHGNSTQQTGDSTVNEKSRASNIKKTFLKAFSIKHKGSEAGSSPPQQEVSLQQHQSLSPQSSPTSSFIKAPTHSPQQQRRRPSHPAPLQSKTTGISSPSSKSMQNSPTLKPSGDNNFGLPHIESNTPPSTTVISSIHGLDANEETPLICHFLNSFISKIEWLYQKGAVKKAKVAKTVEEFFEGIPAACRDTSDSMSINWARAFNRRMLFVKKFIPSETIEFMNEAINTYTEYVDDLSKRGTPPALSNIFVDFKKYFVSHSVDIENSLLGVHTSKALKTKCLQNAQPVSKIQPGMLVAIPTEKYNSALELAFSDYKFARIVTDVMQDGNVGVTIDPCEKDSTFTVQAASILILSEDQEKRINSRCRVEEIVAIPLQNIINELTPLVTSKIAEEITDFLDDNQFYYVDIHKLLDPSEQLSFDSMPVLESLVGWFKQTLGDESFCDYILSTIDFKWKTLKKDLIDAINAHEVRLFSLKADLILKTITSLDLRPVPRKILSEKSSLITSKLDRLKTMYMNVIGGKTKDIMTSEYLTVIREETNKYLTSKGYDHNAIPDNYIDELPADIEPVKNNAKICHEMLVEANNVESDFRAFTNEICLKSYGMIDSWISDVELVLSLELEEPINPIESFIERVTDIIESDTTNKNNDVYKSLVQDISYCQRMKELENAEKTTSLDIVPISGLVYSRVTRLEKECLTVIDVWNHKKSKITKKVETDATTTAIAPEVVTTSITTDIQDTNGKCGEENNIPPLDHV